MGLFQAPWDCVKGVAAAAKQFKAQDLYLQFQCVMV